MATGDGGGCVKDLALRAKESASGVDLSLVATPIGGACNPTATPTTVAVTIPQPLEARDVVDSSTGKPVTVILGSMLAGVTRLPAAFSSSATDTASADPPGWVRTYAGRPASSALSLTISQYVGDVTSAAIFQSPAWIARTTVAINGASATYMQQGYGGRVVDEIIYWHEGEYTYSVRCTLNNLNAQSKLLSQAELTNVAKGLNVAAR
jgi:hypothetical protein